jgi:hypothetical protein
VKSNPQEFKTQYTLAKSASLGGPDTEAKLQAAMSSGADKEKMRFEQTYWNKYNLDAILKKNRTQFIDQATQFDFKRPTQVKDGLLVLGRWLRDVQAGRAGAHAGSGTHQHGHCVRTGLAKRIEVGCYPPGRARRDKLPPPIGVVQRRSAAPAAAFGAAGTAAGGSK